MARRAGRICAHPGCGEVVYRGSRCGAHVEVFHQQDWRAWYRTAEWRRRREEQLRRDPWCVECARQGRQVLATEADHVIPHRGDFDLFFGGELQSMCDSCHSRKTQREVRVWA